MNEAEFILLLKKGNARAYKALVETWQHLVVNTVLGIVQDIPEAEDVAQEVFIQVYQSIAAFRGEAKLSTWIYRIAITKALDRVRKKKTKKRMALVRSWLGKNDAVNEPAHFHHPGVQLDNKERAAHLFRALQQLPETQRIAFLLVKTEGLQYEQVAEIMQLSVKAVEGLMHRAKENLRKQLTRYYNT